MSEPVHTNIPVKSKTPLTAAATVQAVKNEAVVLQDNRPKPVVQKKANSTGLPDNLKSGIENLSGHSMDDVKVHYNSPQPAQLNAHAYAQGNQIHLASGQEKHLPHEAWHVVQQKQGRVKPTMQMKGKVNVNDDKGLEKEADVMGAKALLNPAVAQHKQKSAAQHNPAVVQGWFETALLKDRTKDKRTSVLAKQALEYNSNRKGKTRTTRLNELNALQVAIMQWLDGFEEEDQNVSDVALWVKELMNAAQAEHLELVRQTIVNHDANPPVANFDSLPGIEKTRVQSIWTQLVNGTGNVRITETEDYTHTTTSQPSSRVHAGFRYEVLAQFARLLETQTGREIVAQVNKSTNDLKLVTIKPGFAHPSQGASGSEFAAGPATHHGGDKLTEVKPDNMFKGEKNAKAKRQRYKQKFIDLNLGGIADPKLKAKAIYETRKANPGAFGVRMAGKYFKFGAGTGVDVTITRDIRDAEDHHTSRFVDDNRNEIPTPNFITLGHELGHGAHMLTGVALGDHAVSDHLLPVVGVHGAQGLNWSNMEEYANINAVENGIRGEYNMKHRFGHINQASVQRERLDNIINDFYPLCDLQPMPLRGPVNTALAQAGTATSSLRIAEARTAIRAAATAFDTHMLTTFPDFTPPERTNVRAQLTALRNNVRSAKATVLAAAQANIAQAIVLINTANARIALIPPPPPPPAPRTWRNLWGAL